MKVSSKRGWSSGGCGAESHGGVEIGVWGVCACSWHKECVALGKCRKLFAGGGQVGADKRLEGLMGKRLPRGWRHDRAWSNMEIWTAKETLKDKFEKEWFEACGPVVVEVRSR